MSEFKVGQNVRVLSRKGTKAICIGRIQTISPEKKSLLGKSISQRVTVSGIGNRIYEVDVSRLEEL